jgi:putative hydrolase of the HAD superfamily
LAAGSARTRVAPIEIAGARIVASSVSPEGTVDRGSTTDRGNHRPLVVALDGDDTLWHNETLFVATHDEFRSLLARHVEMSAPAIDELLLKVERRNLGVYGYGIKGFILSMIETAIEITKGRIPADEIKSLLDLGRQMLVHPVALIDGVEEVIAALRQDGHQIWLITKGDLFDQEAKIARSGIAEKFDRIEIVSEKDEGVYQRLLDRQGVAPRDFVMAGNSLRSDVLPVIAIGGRAFHVPYHVTWAHEVVTDHPEAGFVTLDDLRDLPAQLRDIA